MFCVFWHMLIVLKCVTICPLHCRVWCRSVCEELAFSCPFCVIYLQIWWCRYRHHVPKKFKVFRIIIFQLTQNSATETLKTVLVLIFDVDTCCTNLMINVYDIFIWHVHLVRIESILLWNSIHRHSLILLCTSLQKIVIISRVFTVCPNQTS